MFVNSIPVKRVNYKNGNLEITVFLFTSKMTHTNVGLVWFFMQSTINTTALSAQKQIRRDSFGVCNLIK